MAGLSSTELHNGEPFTKYKVFWARGDFGQINDITGSVYDGLRAESTALALLFWYEWNNHFYTTQQ